MKYNTKDGGPAFPLNASDAWGGPTEGMSLRDWFAGQVDASDYIFPSIDVAAKSLNIDPPFDDSHHELMRFSFRAQAAIRYAVADAMLEARKK